MASNTHSSLIPPRIAQVIVGVLYSLILIHLPLSAASMRRIERYYNQIILNSKTI